MPAPLQPWIDWVLKGHEEQLCPQLYGNPDARQCAWPSQLSLDLDERGGHFEQRWTVAREQWIAVPGNSESWPRDVTIDSKPAVVVADSNTPEGTPRLYASPGEHLIAGRFEWRSVPNKLRIPPETGLLTLYVNGQTIAQPERRPDGWLWLERRTVADESVSQLNVVVHRLVIDSVPLQIATRIELIVSGPGREVLLGRALPDGFIPTGFDTPLPARLEPDGRLRVQVRAGRWTIELRARHPGPISALTLPEPGGDWDADEVWVFETQPHLRVVTVEGVDPIDPQQTELLDDWRQYPAYVMKLGSTMKLVEQRRGDSDPAADEVNLERTLWLDSDGGGYTINDRIGGVLRRSWRLEMPLPTQLGRVAVSGQDQFLTRLGDSPSVGVEIRQGALDLDADARVAGNVWTIPAVGWDLDFNNVNGTLNLPPGWRLLHATGVDVAAPTWVTSWTLFDFFVVLIIVLAIARLWNVLWAALALLTLGLTFNEPDAPQFAWIGVLAAEALIRVLPEGRLQILVRFGRLVAAVVLAVGAVPFMVQQARQGLYPVLERPSYSVVVGRDVAPEPPPMAESEEDAGRGVAQRYSARRKIAAAAPLSDTAAEGFERRYQSVIDPKAVVQTGPGLPNWTWNQVALRWQGPVERQQLLHLYLVPPWLTGLLAAARVLLIALLLARLMPRPTTRQALVATAGLLALARLDRPASADDTPPTQLFDELRTRLLEPPECHPYCATVGRMRVEAAPEAMQLRLEVHVVAASAIPLPGHASQWLPAVVVVDDRPGAVLAQMDGTLWVQLPAGVHLVLAEGPLPQRDTVQLALPMRPQRVDTEMRGWEVNGVHDSGLADETLQLTRLSTQEAARTELKPDTLPAFVSIERRILLPLSWRVETRVIRLTPLGTAVVLEVPLLAGESVNTPGMRVSDGKIQINMPAQVMATGWESTLEAVSPIRLQAPNVTTWVESWVVDASPIWHVEADGIPAVHQPTSDVRERRWQPWPGEAVTLDITRPEGVPGQTLTIDRATVEIMPGIRATDVTATIELRSNRGAQHTVTLPENAQLQSVVINDGEVPIRQDGRRVTLPISPGRQTVTLKWRQNDGIMRRFSTPQIDLGAPSVNVELRVAFPEDRWILFVGGPRRGPAVLFWSSLAIVLIIAIGLDRIRLTPLRAHHWFLLGIGLTQIPVGAAAVVVGWLLVFCWRRNRVPHLPALAFDAFQLLLVVWTCAALAALLWAIQQGLLGLPEMQIAGNGSSATSLRWYQDRADGELPYATVYSVPLLAYRLLMLTWALWIAQALLGWLRWAWESFSTGGYWRPLRQKRA